MGMRLGLARYELQQAIWAAGDKFIYADTDSVKYAGSLDLTEYNKEKVSNSTASGAFADDPKGARHYMGVFEDEGRYKQFVTMGAKKYAYFAWDKKKKRDAVHLTVAGVAKEAGADELEKAGGLEAFKPGLIFRDAGGTEAIYNDTANITLHIDGHELYIGPNVCLKPSTYTLKYGKDYAELLDNLTGWTKIDHEEALKTALEGVEIN